MGQCKICGKEIEDGQDLCEQCQEDMEQVDISGLDELNLDDLNLDNINIDEIDLPELSEDTRETNLEFNLEDADNDLENPSIVVRDKDAKENTTEKQEELPIVDTMETVEENENTDSILDIPDVPDPLEAEVSEAADAGVETDPIMDVPEMAEDVMPDLDSLLDLSEETTMDSSEEQAATNTAAMEEALPESNEEGLDLTDLLGEETTTEGIADSNTQETEETTDALGLGDLGLDLGIGDVADLSLDLGDDSESLPLNDTNADIAMMEGLPDAEVMAEVAESKKKVSIWKRLFGNVKDEKWEKKKEEEAKKEELRLAQEEEKKKAAEMEKTEEGEETEKIDPKEAKKAAKLAKKEEKAKRKAEKKAQREQQKELIDEDEEEGRINRVGAVLVFAVLGIVAVFVIAGTNVFSYKSSIKRASGFFKEDQYAKAYDELNGLTIKKKDENLYKQVRTVMYVNKELDSYHNYTKLRMYPEALDSLLKGLEKYDYYLESAREVDVTEDYDKVKNQILLTLKKEYNMTEKKAYALLDNKDQGDYSKKVIKIANE